MATLSTTAVSVDAANTAALQMRVSVFGEFRLSVGNSTISDASSRSLKLWNLLAYLILHRDRPVTQSELIENFWSEEERNNPLSALKMTVRRIRDMLEPLLGQGVSPIIGRRGAYQWNAEISCDIDAEHFEQLCRLANSSTLSENERKSLYHDAISLYKDDLLPKLDAQQWLIPLSAHFHDRYVTAAKDYAALLEKDGQYAEMAELCVRACELNPMDEALYVLVIRALLLQKKNAAALRYYEKAVEQLYYHLGSRPSDELRALYVKITSEEKSSEEDLGTILTSMRGSAKESDSNGPVGAFVCEYSIFEAIYQLEARRATRSGSCLHVALVTLSTAAGEVPPLKTLGVVMPRLQDVIVQSLRVGDVVSCYSNTQFVVMLPGANLEDSGMVMGRIIAAFNRQNRRNMLHVSYKLRNLELF